jgi:pSer/pThr/pTyr-binding forkhead associated (FHA) protein
MGDEIPILVAQGGPLNGQRWSLRKKTIIGRENTCAITIPERQVSRQHASLTPSRNGIELEDLGSKNGTHCNGKPLQEKTLLQDGDVIQIALVQSFVFMSSDATLPLDSEEPSLLMQTSTLLRLEKRSRRVWVGNQEIIPPLSLSQYKLLEMLYDHQNQLVSRNDLIEFIWGEKQAILVSDQALDALVRRLRERINEIGYSHDYIATVRGPGLRLDNPEIN